MTIPRLELRGISKSFPAVKALENVGLCLRSGEIHALLGENGAGKSTLIKVMTGALNKDSGEIILDGQTINIGSTGAAQKLGISSVYQEVNLIPAMSVVQNMTLGRQATRFGLVSWKKARQTTTERLARLGLDINVERAVGSFSVAIQQLIAIARALEDNTKVLVLDEPTASLDASETQNLFKIMRDLKRNGIAIVFITHFLDQVYEVSDHISVLRNGRLVGSSNIQDLARKDLITMMIGRELEGLTKSLSKEARQSGAAPLFSAQDVGAKRKLSPFDLELSGGEVVGLAGLLGSGRTEMAKIVFGAIRADSGTMTMDGETISNHSPRNSLRLGIALCPEDRKTEGLIGELTIRENIMLSLQAKNGWLKQIPRQEQARIADEMIDALDIATPDAEKPVGQLSGGNQQKVILARSLASQPRLLLLDEPTRGIDVGAHAEIIALIRKLCNDGLALLVASSELDEIVVFADRVVVLRDREKVGEISGDALNRDTIIQTIASE